VNDRRGWSAWLVPCGRLYAGVYSALGITRQCIVKSANPVFKETTMAAKKAAVASILKFKKEWIFDPPPPFLHIDRAAILKINQLRDEFVKNVNAVIEAGQIR
jgi:hypothetical protein